MKVVEGGNVRRPTVEREAVDPRFDVECIGPPHHHRVDGRLGRREGLSEDGHQAGHVLRRDPLGPEGDDGRPGEACSGGSW